MSQETIEKIKRLAAQYESKHQTNGQNTTARLNKLVDLHGIDAVAAATGLKPATVAVYHRQKPNTTLNSYPSSYVVAKAEYVLSQI